MDTIEVERVVAVEERNWWYRERRHLVARELRRLGRPGTGLDVGAAGGGNTRVLLDRGWEAVAVDASPAGVEAARRRGVDARLGDACDLPFPDASFDFAMALDVLEHIEDDAGAARELARVVRPGGAALVTVPCDMRLWSAHDEALGHVRRYDRADLAEVLTDAGFEIGRLWSWNVLLRPVVRMRRRASTGCDLEALPGWLDRSLHAVVAAERALPVGALPGVSLVARLTRP
ncbi:class I SAM-dependent methyltransferase [Actinomadura gamaensis]|uniref:Class I SAM-dependent methyltransferase n=1 Tax=Actinomadura gamaensis TaxID=1763541 RepID=A0ABV9U703_9ACTN